MTSPTSPTNPSRTPSYRCVDVGSGTLAATKTKRTKERVELQPGESRQVTLTADPRLLASFDGTAGHWRIAEGTHRVALARSAEEPVLTADTALTGRHFGT
jgi:Fibronectin type III-like domain